MSLFEELVEELKDEDLLESTVIENKRNDDRKGASENPGADEGGVRDEVEQAAEILDPEPDGEVAQTDLKREKVEIRGYNFQLDSRPDSPSEDEHKNDKNQAESESGPRPRSSGYLPRAKKRKGESGKEFFRRRATDEVKGLQMVDHIITRIEKEQAKINAAPFDDLKVKQSLHLFLKLDSEANTSEVAEIEFMLLQETENWYSALSMRDKQISVENLRSYCESTVPVLSSRALLALARFYRNSPYSELVRSKFDLIVTKLYTAGSDDGKREVILPREQLVEDIEQLYAEWSSVPLYSVDEDESELELGALGFEDFIEEAEKAVSFEELGTKKFFRRLNDFKKRSGESFFAPRIVVAAIECNVEVGNRCVDLIKEAEASPTAEELSDKYGFLSDSALAEALRRVLSKGQDSSALDVKEAPKKRQRRSEEPAGDLVLDLNKVGRRIGAEEDETVQWYRANPKIIGATALTVALAIAYFFFGSHIVSQEGGSISADVQKVNLDKTELGKYVITARISKSTMYVITNETWNSMDNSSKEEIMKKFLAAGIEKGFTQVNFLNSEGKRMGFVSASKLEITR